MHDVAALVPGVDPDSIKIEADVLSRSGTPTYQVYIDKDLGNGIAVQEPLKDASGEPQRWSYTGKTAEQKQKIKEELQKKREDTFFRQQDFIQNSRTPISERIENSLFVSSLSVDKKNAVKTINEVSSDVGVPVYYDSYCNCRECSQCKC